MRFDEASQFVGERGDGVDNLVSDLDLRAGDALVLEIDGGGDAVAARGGVNTTMAAVMLVGTPKVPAVASVGAPRRANVGRDVDVHCTA